MLKSKIIYLNVTKLCHSSYYRFGQAHSPNSGQNHYQVLGISQNATIEQVKSAYRELSKKHHPDVSKDPNSLEKFKQISNAYSILKDEKSRTQYDANNTYDYDKPTANTYKYSSARSQSANSSQRENAGTSRRYQSNSDKSDEEILYETIFRKTFRSDPSFYYKPENEALRKKYEEELEKLRREKGEHADYSSGAGASGYQHEDPEESREWREFMREFSKNKEEGSKGAKEDASAFNSDAFKRSPLPNWAKAILALGSGALIYVLTIEVIFDV